MKKMYFLLVLISLSVSVFATPQISGKAEYVLRYMNGELIQEIGDFNSSTLSLGENFVGKVSFSLYESKTIANYFSEYVHSPILSQSLMAKLVFDEFYLQYEGENSELTVGKYYSGWGVSPLINPIDLLSPYDFTNVFDSPTKLPIEGARGVLYFNNSQIELDVVPEFLPDLYQTLPATFENMPSKLENIELGARYQTELGNYNISIDIYHGFTHAYIPIGRTLLHPSLNAIGGEFSGPFPLDQNYGFYGEAMYLLCGKIQNITGLIGINSFGSNCNWGVEYERGLPGQSPFDLENVLTLYGTKNLTDEISTKGTFSFGKDGDSCGTLVSMEMDIQPIQNLNLSLGFNLSKSLKGMDYFKSSERMNSLYVKGTVYF